MNYKDMIILQLRNKQEAYRDKLKTDTSFLPRLLASLKPSENMITSAMRSISGFVIATGRNSCFRLSGNF